MLPATTDGSLVSMTGDRKAPPDLKGIAGYESPYPYMDRLQEKMEERLAHRVPATGRFCGFCYGRPRESDSTCGFCSADIAEAGTVPEIPQDVLRAYQVRQKSESRWVYGGAFLGLIIASVAFVLMVTWGPGPLGHPAAAFAMLIGGGYLLAQLFGPLLGGQIGYRRGARARDTLWAQHLATRDGANDRSRAPTENGPSPAP